jgi:hypothetical protein
MGRIDIKKSFVAIHSFDCSAVEPENMNFKEEDIEIYLKIHLMPIDKCYTVEEMKYDLTESGGALTFDSEIQESTIEYIRELLNYLVNKDEE